MATVLPDLRNSVVARILLRISLVRIPPSSIPDHPGLPLARLLLGQLVGVPLPFLSLFSNLLSTGSLILLIGYKFLAAFALFRLVPYLPSFISVVLHKVSLAILRSVRITPTMV